MKINIDVYVLEDEQSHADWLAQQLNQYTAESHSLHFKPHFSADLPAFAEKITSWPTLKNQLFIIDIHLQQQLTGIDIAQRIQAVDPDAMIIFFTSDEQAGMEVINRQTMPFGYLVKQLDRTAQQAHFFSLLRSFERQILVQKQSGQFIHLKQGSRHLLLKPAEILYIASSKAFPKKVLVKTADQEFICNDTLAALKEMLFEQHFFKEMKSFIVNTQHIQSYCRLKGLICFPQQELYVGKKVVDKLRGYLKNQQGKEV